MATPFVFQHKEYFVLEYIQQKHNKNRFKSEISPILNLDCNVLQTKKSAMTKERDKDNE